MAWSGPAARIPVVMLYDRSHSVHQAMATYSHLMRELAGEFQPDLRVWHVEDATSPEHSAQANDDIAAAAVIIMNVRGDEQFPAAFQHWKGGSMQPDSAPPRAVIALIGGAGIARPTADTWRSVLCREATQIHPEVFVYEPREGASFLAVVVLAQGMAAPRAIPSRGGLT